jgi:hypothetical protein
MFLFVLGLVLFFIASIYTPPADNPWRLRFISAGLFCWALSTATFF